MSKKDKQKPQPISGKQLGPTYKRNKSQFDSEAEALASVLKSKPKERQSNLITAHTEKQYIWKAKTKFD